MKLYTNGIRNILFVKKKISYVYLI